jgi:hypothetical protein
MAGRLTVSTLNDDTGVLATQNGMIGITKAWVNFNGTGTPAIRASMNVSSITDNGTGDYTINFTVAMPNNSYAIQGCCDRNPDLVNGTIVNQNNLTTATTSAVRITVFRVGTGVVDCASVYVSVFSS